MKNEILTDKQYNSKENQNRDNTIIGYRSVEKKVNDNCEHNVIFKHEDHHVCGSCGVKIVDIKNYTK